MAGGRKLYFRYDGISMGANSFQLTLSPMLLSRWKVMASMRSQSARSTQAPSNRAIFGSRSLERKSCDLKNASVIHTKESRSDLRKCSKRKVTVLQRA